MAETIDDLKQKALADHQAGRLDAAVRQYQAILARIPDDADVLHMLGVARFQQGDPISALQIIEQALREDPGFAAVHVNQARILMALGRLPEARRAIDQALAKGGADFGAVSVAAEVAFASRDWAAARDLYSSSLGQSPQDPRGWHNLAICQQYLECFDDARRAYHQALRLDPGNSLLCFNYALLLEKVGEEDAAAEALQRALALQPDYADAEYRLAYLQVLNGDWRELETTLARLTPRLQAIDPDAGEASLNPHILNSLGLPAAFNTPIAANFARQIRNSVAAFTRNPVRQADASGPLTRIGYISPDFCDHAVGRLIADLFACHDRNEFRVHAYSLRRHEDPIRERIRAGCDQFTDCGGMDFATIADRIRADDIQILIDLGGYTRGAVPEVLALRPAPVQISWLGYLASMQADFIDYFIADPVTLPEAAGDDYRENILRLPRPLLPVPPGGPVADAPTRASQGLPEDGVVLASFNNSYKISAALFDCWLDILEATPEAVLWLYDGGRRRFRENLQAAATRRNLGNRLVFAEALPAEAHLARATLADLCLDTWHYNGGATAVSMLHAGVPVLCRAGNTVLSRMTAALNRYLGLENLVCGDEQEYRRKAMTLAGDPARLTQCRRQLSAALEATDLCDPAAFCHDLEAGYRTAWQNFRDGKEVADINLQ